MIRSTPKSTRTDTPVPDATLYQTTCGRAESGVRACSRLTKTAMLRLANRIARDEIAGGRCDARRGRAPKERSRVAAGGEKRLGPLQRSIFPDGWLEFDAG